MIIRISFKGDLKQILHKKSSDEFLVVESHGKRSVKDLIQSLGVPHTEVGEITVDRKPVDLTYLLNEDAAIEVFPSLSPRSPIDNPCFICDVHLWKLSRRLRFLGFDTFFHPELDDGELADLSGKDHRILLTRDRGLLMRNKISLGLLIRNTHTDKQVKEVLERLGISHLIKPFIRCFLCNGLLDRLNQGDILFREKVKNLIPPNVLEWCTDFHFCFTCHKVYWKGSHSEKLNRLLNRYLD